MRKLKAVEDVLEWTLRHRRPVRVIVLDRVGVIGEGPIPSLAFSEMLRCQDIEPCLPSSTTATIVVGRNGWSNAQLDNVIEARRGKTLRIYSQELFLAFLLAGVDPLDDDSGTLEELGSGHPALESLMSKGFKWPTTQAAEGIGEGVRNEWEEIGFLGYLGYRVGANGLYRNQRCRILEDAYTGFLPDDLFGEDYTKSWGKPRSQDRLKRIACSIASFCKRAKKKKSPPELAIHDWELDLEWLKERYYSRRLCQFRWPSTVVH